MTSRNFSLQIGLLCIMLSAAQKIDPDQKRAELLTVNEEEKIEIYEGLSQRHAALPDQVRIFALPLHALEKNQRYDVKLSWLGSEGVDMRVFWLNPKTPQDDTIVFRPHDTEKLHFLTNSEAQVDGVTVIRNHYYRVGVVGYRNTRASTRTDQDRQFEYIIKLEKVFVIGLPSYVLQQLALIALVLQLIIVYHFYSKKSCPPRTQNYKKIQQSENSADTH